MCVSDVMQISGGHNGQSEPNQECCVCWSSSPRQGMCTFVCLNISLFMYCLFLYLFVHNGVSVYIDFYLSMMTLDSGHH